jgi:hypothetical protein
MQEAQRDPTLAGELTLHFLVTERGRVTGVRVAGPLASDAVKACVAKHVAALAFPATGAAVQINYPLRFQLAPSTPHSSELVTILGEP